MQLGLVRVLLEQTTAETLCEKYWGNAGSKVGSQPTDCGSYDDIAGRTSDVFWNTNGVENDDSRKLFQEEYDKIIQANAEDKESCIKVLTWLWKEEGFQGCPWDGYQGTQVDTDNDEDQGGCPGRTLEDYLNDGYVEHQDRGDLECYGKKGCYKHIYKKFDDNGCESSLIGAKKIKLYYNNPKCACSGESSDGDGSDKKDKKKKVALQIDGKIILCGKNNKKCINPLAMYSGKIEEPFSQQLNTIKAKVTDKITLGSDRGFPNNPGQLLGGAPEGGIPKGTLSAAMALSHVHPETKGQEDIIVRVQNTDPKVEPITFRVYKVNNLPADIYPIWQSYDNYCKAQQRNLLATGWEATTEEEDTLGQSEVLVRMKCPQNGVPVYWTQNPTKKNLEQKVQTIQNDTIQKSVTPKALKILQGN